MASTKHTCAACGFDGLRSPQRSSSGGASHEICPSCGFEPGYTDDDQEISPEKWAAQWRASGSKWFSKGIAPPAKKASSTKKRPATKAPKKNQSPRTKNPSKKSTTKRKR